MRFKRTCYLFKLETDRYHFFDTDILKIFSTDIWPVPDFRLATDTDISKFAYRYVRRYFNKVFWLKLLWIDYRPDLRQSD